MSASASESVPLPFPESEYAGGAVWVGGMRGRDSSTRGCQLSAGLELKRQLKALKSADY